VTGASGDRVQPLPGHGLVAREGSLSLVCALPDASTGAVVDALLSALADVAAAGEDGRSLVRRVIGVLSSSTSPAGAAPLACAVAGPVADGMAVLVGGAARALVVTEAGAKIDIGGDPAYTWTDRVVGDPVAQLELVLPEALDADPRLRLDSGVVRGGGLRQISRTREVATTPPPASPGDHGPPVSLRHRARPAAPSSPPPTRVDVSALPVQRPDPEPPHVLGINCKNHHFNDPRAHYCVVCGISMMQATLTPFRGPRPPLGVLLVDDGQTLPLRTDVLIGRDPRHAEEVTDRTAIPLRITDSEGSISRRHTLVNLDEWQVRLIDLGSVNGTAIMPRGGAGFERIHADEAVVLRPGSTVRIGRSRTFRFESNRED
jgi:hypothetical protein